MRSLAVGATLGLLVACGSSAEALPILTLVPDSTQARVGDSVDVALNISGLVAGDAPSLGAFDLDVTFDPGVLVWTGTVFGDPARGDQLDLFGLGSLTSSALSSQGRLNIMQLSFYLPQDLDLLQADAFTLATLSFTAAAVGTSAIGLDVHALSDAAGGRLEPTTIGTEVSVVPEPATWLLVATGLAGCAMRRRRTAQRQMSN